MRSSLRSLAVVAFFLAGCKHGTPAGTVLADWKHEPVSSAVGPSRTVGADVEWPLEHGTARYHFDTDVGGISIGGGSGPTIPATGPRHVRVTLVEGAGVNQSVKCMDTPAMTTASDGSGARVSVSCFVTAQLSAEGTRLFVVDADGHVTHRPLGKPGAAAAGQ